MVFLQPFAVEHLLLQPSLALHRYVLMQEQL
jgi:hypothetical protein